MSEYEPITNELRAAVDYAPQFLAPDVAQVDAGEFDRCCDAIDAVHAQLERENAELRERVAELDKRGDSMHDGGSITDELRKWGYGFCGDTHDAVTAIADRIDAEHQKSEDEWRAKNGDMWLKGYAACHEELMEGHPVIAADLEKAGWVKLPVDADGVSIRIGDVMEGTCPSGKHVNGTVNAIGDGVFWLSNVQFSLKPDYMHHHHAPTVEDVLREFAEKITDSQIPGVHPTYEEAIAEYAKRLTLAKGEGE